MKERVGRYFPAEIKINKPGEPYVGKRPPLLDTHVLRWFSYTTGNYCEAGVEPGRVAHFKTNQEKIEEVEWL